MFQVGHPFSSPSDLWERVKCVQRIMRIEIWSENQVK